MKSVVRVCLLGLALTSVAGTQGVTKPVLRKGISVEMPVASHAAEMRAADELDATVVTITAEGKVFIGAGPVVLTALGSLNAGTVYVKADSRVPYQKVLSVLDALHGRTVALLTAPPQNVEKGRIVPPYGIKLTVVR